MAINSCDICGCIPANVDDRFFNQAALNLLCGILAEMQGGVAESVNLASIGGVAVTTALMGIQVEDAAHVSGDSGIQVLGVANENGAQLSSTAGDYTPLAVDRSGNVNVILTKNIPGGSPGNWAVRAEDDAHASGDAGIPVWGVANENGTQLSSTAGDYTPFAVDRSGNLNVLLGKTIPGGSPGNWAVRAEDSAFANTDAVVMVGAVNNRSATAYNATNGDVTPFAVNDYGSQFANHGDFANITTATTTTVKSGAGFLHRIIINKAVATGTYTIYDNTAASGTKVGTVTQPGAVLTTPMTLEYGVRFGTGLTIVTSSTDDITVVFT